MDMEEVEQLLDDCEKRESRLTDWEAKFVDSIRRRVDEGKRLTPPQEATLNTIWEQVTKKG